MNKLININNSLDKVKFFTGIQIIFVIFAFLGEGIVNKNIITVSFILQLIILSITFNFYYLALKNLYYTFWNLSFVLLAFYILSIFRNFIMTDHLFLFFLYFMATLFMLTNLYIISSPLYFPRVNWWEYDFRFRNDLPVEVDYENTTITGRLSDLRRGAGCLELFKSVPIGEYLNIRLSVHDQNFILACEVRSRREPIRGRSIVYGVKFQSGDLEHRQRLKLLMNYWKVAKITKMKKKFSQNL